jgi:hypothetical protein
MRAILVEANRDLLRQIDLLNQLIGQACTPAELTPYVASVASVCSELRRDVLRNLQDLEYSLPQSYEDTLHATMQLTTTFELVNTRFAQPIVRSRSDDRLVLLILRWLHDVHRDAAGVAFAFSDGDFGVWPAQPLPVIYFLPTSRQHTLLYLPLFFHEFGHLLFACHQPELEDLTKDFQRVVRDQVSPLTVRGRDLGGPEGDFREEVVSAWFSWVQEFFCDAVGLSIGGPCFLKAFSHFFRTRSEDAYHVPSGEQVAGEHPVTWLRIRLLVDRAMKLGFCELADRTARAWDSVARTLGVAEDYEGTWADELFDPLRKTIEDMLVEAGPRLFCNEDLQMRESGQAQNPVGLCTGAWDRFEADPDSYAAWEREAARAYLASH